MPKAVKTTIRTLRPLVVKISGAIGAVLVASAFISSLQNSLGAG